MNLPCMPKARLELTANQLPLPLDHRDYRYVLLCLADLSFLVQIIFQGNLIADERKFSMEEFQQRRRLRQSLLGRI